MNIDTDLVRRLINSQFPKWQDYDIKPVSPQGWDNRTFHLGSNMSIRLPSSESYTPQAEKEQTWLPFLSQKLPFQIPVLLEKGNPSEMFPYKWGIYKWLDGDNLELELISDISRLAKDIARFLTQLQKIDTVNAPLAGRHCFYRGAPLEVYHAETKRAIHNLSEVLGLIAKEIWDKAVGTRWEKPPVWFHGDMAKGNILVKIGTFCFCSSLGPRTPNPKPPTPTPTNPSPSPKSRPTAAPPCRFGHRAGGWPRPRA
jgi:aminoglycoside phosphotransferase (APT) family kinase protein